MAHIKPIEALHCSLKIFRENEWLFSGALILWFGDFLQTFPVITRSTPVDELNTSFISSLLW